MLLKNAFWLLPQREPTQLAPLLVELNERPVPLRDRRDIEPLELASGQSRQLNVQPGDLDHVFGKTEPAPAGRNNYGRLCAAGGDQGAGVPFEDAGANFPSRAGNNCVRQIIGEESRHIPRGATGQLKLS